MNILLTAAFAVIGYIALWLTSDRAIIYTLQVACMYKLSSLFIGFFLLGMATGLPEFVIALQTWIIGKPMLSVGDIIGSNFADVACAFGLATALFGPVAIPTNERHKHITMLFMSILLMGGLFIVGNLTRTVGVCLVAIYLLVSFYLWKTGRQTFIEDTEEQVEILQEDIGKEPRKKLFGKLATSLILVIVASKICVDNTLILAAYMGLPIDIMGVSLVALGTSLPEISLNIQAMRRKNYSLALGNSLGSIFEQGALILGLFAIGNSQTLTLHNLYHVIPFMAFAYGLLAYRLLAKGSIKKIYGWLLLSCYGLFLLYEAWYIFFDQL